MLYNAVNEHIRTAGADFDFISFGNGRRPFFILPGVGDGFQTAKGLAAPFAAMYRCFARDFRVYVFSRRNVLPEGFTTRDMAEDLAHLMDVLGIRSAHVLGVSQGGMIAQQLAIRHPDKVDRLVLAVTCARPNGILLEAGEQWLQWAREKDYRSIMMDTAERSYTGRYLERNRKLYEILSRAAKPKDFTRFEILCRSCFTHDVYDELNQIKSPTLVIGGGQDRIVGVKASEEIAEKIPDCRLLIYEEYSHGVYEQAKDFNDRILQFLLEKR